MIALFYLAPMNSEGGSKVYLWHLFQALRLVGADPAIYRVGKRGGVGTIVGLPCRIVTLEEAVRVVRSAPSYAAYAMAHPSNPELCAAITTLIVNGLVYTVQAHAEVRDWVVELLRQSGRLVIATRPTLATLLTTLGCRVAHLPHPYVRATTPPSPPTRWAVCATRVDWSKNVHLCCEANERLPVAKHIALVGSLNAGRRYQKSHLDKYHPSWRTYHSGTNGFPFGEGVSVAASARYVLDLTYWKHDGGGSQYCFLEAWDAKTPLLVHKRWLAFGGEMRDGVNCIGVETAEDIVSVLMTDNIDLRHRVVEGGLVGLKPHALETVAKAYVEAITR